MKEPTGIIEGLQTQTSQLRFKHAATLESAIRIVKEPITLPWVSTLMPRSGFWIASGHASHGCAGYLEFHDMKTLVKS
ncbi:MAG: hypothetical protein NTV46_17430 [Verrucomicrobia bacterium]|nr:hypothetical protein [Verrucomicrobiota bacterium]